MNRYLKLIFILNIIFLLSACSTNSQRLSTAEEKSPVIKVDSKLKKYIQQLYSSEPTERAWAAYNIGKLASLAMHTVAYLIAILNDDATAVMTRYIGKNFTSNTTTTPADEAVKALAKIGRASVKPLIAALKDSDKKVVLKAIKTLGLIRDNESIKPLADFLNYPDIGIRLEAANSLSRFKNPWVADYLLTALKNKDPVVRYAALYALGKLKSPVVIPELIALLKDPDLAIRSQAIYVLSKFRDERIIQPLIEQTKLNDVAYRIDVINALGNIRDYRVIERLLVLLKYNNKEIKFAAAAALAQIADVNFGVNFSKWKNWWKNKLQRSTRR